MLRNVLANYVARCNNSCLKSTWKLCAAKPAKKSRIFFVEFISTMLRMHAANSSRKWRLLIKNAKIEKSDLKLSTYVQMSDEVTEREYKCR